MSKMTKWIEKHSPFNYRGLMFAGGGMAACSFVLAAAQHQYGNEAFNFFVAWFLFSSRHKEVVKE